MEKKADDIDKTRPRSPDTVCDEHLQRNVAKLTRKATLVIAICTTIVLFILPIVFYFTTAYASDSAELQSNTSVANASIDSNSSTCVSITWGVLEATDPLTCEQYQGPALCMGYLQQWHSCLLPPEQELRVDVTVKTQTALSEEFQTLLSLLDSFPECRESAIPFLCHYYFPLLDCETGYAYFSTQEDCQYISNDVCASPWSLAVYAGYEDKLPDCLSLPVKNNNNKTTSNAQNDSNVRNISCRQDFVLIDNTTCYPRCDRFEEHPHNPIQAMLVAEIIAGLIAATFSITALILSVYNRKNMLKFPSILLLFFVGDVFIAAILVLIAAVDRNSLLCSSINLIEAINSPTVFCSISGALFHYVIVNMVVWWFFHLSFFFYEIMFPFHSHQMKSIGRLKYTSIVLIVLGLFIPLPGVIVALSSHNHHYRLIRFPPSVCTTDNELWFYSTTLIFTVLIGTGVCLLIVIFWVVNKHQTSSARMSGKKRKLSTAEQKIIMVSISFIVFGVFTMIHLGIVTGNADKVGDAFTEYFVCESTGHVPGKCDRSIFERHLYPYMSVIAYLLMGMVPIAILNFIVNWQNLWKSIKKQFEKLNRLSSTQTPSTSGSSMSKRFSFDRISMRSVRKQSSVATLPGPVTPV